MASLRGHNTANTEAYRCMAVLEGLLPLSSCAFYQVDPQLQPQAYLLHQMPSQVHQHYLTQYQQYDPLLPMHLGERAVVPILEVLKPQTKTVGPYERFLAEHNMSDVLEILLRQQGRVVAGFSLIRFGALGRFSATEIATVQHVHSLLELALGPLLSTIHTVPNAAIALTEREQQVVKLLCEGACNKRIARELNIALSTVKTHLLHLFRKFEVKSRTELLSLFLSQ